METLRLFKTLIFVVLRGTHAPDPWPGLCPEPTGGPGAPWPQAKLASLKKAKNVFKLTYC